jgi:hypothetical protein
MRKWPKQGMNKASIMVKVYAGICVQMILNAGKCGQMHLSAGICGHMKV